MESTISLEIIELGCQLGYMTSSGGASGANKKDKKKGVSRRLSGAVAKLCQRLQIASVVGSIGDSDDSLASVNQNASFHAYFDKWIATVHAEAADHASFLVTVANAAWYLGRCAVAIDRSQLSSKSFPYACVAWRIVNSCLFLAGGWPGLSRSPVVSGRLGFAVGYLLTMKNCSQYFSYHLLREYAIRFLDGCGGQRSTRLWCAGLFVVGAARQGDGPFYLGLLTYATADCSSEEESSSSSPASPSSSLETRVIEWTDRLKRAVIGDKPKLALLRTPSLPSDKPWPSHRARLTDCARCRLLHTALRKGPPGLVCACSLCSFSGAELVTGLSAAARDFPCWLLAHFAVAAHEANDPVLLAAVLPGFRGLHIMREQFIKEKAQESSDFIEDWKMAKSFILSNQMSIDQFFQ